MRRRVCGIAPGHELAHAVRILLRPEQHPLQWGWLRSVREKLPREPFALLTRVIGADGYMPDFLTTAPRWDLTPADELAALRPSRRIPRRVTRCPVYCRTRLYRQCCQC